MIVHQTMTATGAVIFTPFECTYCRLDTSGLHEKYCPMSLKPKKTFIEDPIEDYSDITEPM